MSFPSAAIGSPSEWARAPGHGNETSRNAQRRARSDYLWLVGFDRTNVLTVVPTHREYAALTLIQAAFRTQGV